MYEYLHTLTIYASKGNALEYRAIWNDWRYCELVEFAVGIARSKTKMWKEISGKEYEYAEQYNAELLARILESV